MLSDKNYIEAREKFERVVELESNRGDDIKWYKTNPNVYFFF